jgi:hypothetical protein
MNGYWFAPLVSPDFWPAVTLIRSRGVTGSCITMCLLYRQSVMRWNNNFVLHLFFIQTGPAPKQPGRANRSGKNGLFPVCSIPCKRFPVIPTIAQAIPPCNNLVRIEM